MKKLLEWQKSELDWIRKLNNDMLVVEFECAADCGEWGRDDRGDWVLQAIVFELRARMCLAGMLDYPGSSK